MAEKISRAEAWEVVHVAFTQINFNSFDFSTIKGSLLDYVKLYFPEDFNDYIESSEFVALLEIFAYVGELLAYRIDLNAHENFITTAQRKESILRLAKLISYKASRNIAARGLVKITSVQSTEKIIDSQGRNLSSRTIIWNDLNNQDWKEQFLLVMNRVLSQEFGSVGPNERVQIEDVLFELYTWENQQIRSNGITTFPYSATSSGQSFPMELVPVELTSDSPIEKRPERTTKFSLLYGSDGLGDGSDTTGFFCFTKQGTLSLQTESFDGVTPNQTLDVEVANINETDVWLNNVSASTRDILITDPFAEILPHLADGSKRYGEWFEVDLATGQNILFNTDSNRQKFEIETLDEDKIKLVFGDGEFSDIPSGEFDLWYRTSANSNVAIQQSSVVDQTASFTYLDLTNTTQSFTFTFTLINSLQNNSVSEDIEHIRRVAPSVYYTQDRMVNGRDYNSFMLKDPSILKLRAVNRTFAGDSKYIAWHDPKEYYEDVKIFGEDLALYWIEKEPENGGLNNINSPLVAQTLIANHIEPLLCSAAFYNVMVDEFAKSSNNIQELRCVFSATEENNIIAALDITATGGPAVDLFFSAEANEWTVGAHLTQPSIFMINITAQIPASVLAGWIVTWRTKRMIAESTTTRFRHTNTTASIINFNTLNSNDDKVVVLGPNFNGTGTGLLTDNNNYNVLGQELVEQNTPNAGLPDENKLSVIPTDVNDDGIPDNLTQSELLDATESQTYASPTITFTIPNMSYMPTTSSESLIVTIDGVQWQEGTGAGTYSEITSGNNPSNQIELNSIPAPAGNIVITNKQYVYFFRETTASAWKPIPDTDLNKNAWAADQPVDPNDPPNLYKREYGRFPVNFAWFYTTPRLHLIDPAPSNIIDTFIITRGYYQGLQQWLEGKTNTEPTPPTPLDLRTAYSELLENRMISDTVILQSGLIKVLFGSKAIPELQATFKIIRPTVTNLTDNEVKVKVVNAIRIYFDINFWDFGETFFFTELSAAIHNSLGPEINSVVLVPTFATNQFGDLFQVQSRENEIFAVDISTNDIEIIESFTPENIRQ